MSNLTASIRHLGTADLAVSSWTGLIFSSIRRIFAEINDGVDRSQQRRALREMADGHDQHLLRDIGLTRGEAYREAAKWFWQH